MSDSNAFMNIASLLAQTDCKENSLDTEALLGNMMQYTNQRLHDLCLLFCFVLDSIAVQRLANESRFILYEFWEHNNVWKK